MPSRNNLPNENRSVVLAKAHKEEAEDQELATDYFLAGLKGTNLKKSLRRISEEDKTKSK